MYEKKTSNLIGVLGKSLKKSVWIKFVLEELSFKIPFRISQINNILNKFSNELNTLSIFTTLLLRQTKPLHLPKS